MALDDGRREWLLGRDDHLGLRVVRDGARVRVFERLCRHEGASLDRCPTGGGALECPWHGRRVAPLATFTLDGAPRSAATACHRFSLERDGDRRTLHVAPA